MRLTNQDTNEGSDGETVLLEELDGLLLPLLRHDHAGTELGLLLTCIEEFSERLSEIITTNVFVCAGCSDCVCESAGNDW